MLRNAVHTGANREPTRESKVVRVAAQSRSSSVAGAIAHIMREQGYVEVHAIGAGAVNQALKAVAIARNHLACEGIDSMFTPQFTEVDIDGETRTAIKFMVEQRFQPQP